MRPENLPTTQRESTEYSSVHSRAPKEYLEQRMILQISQILGDSWVHRLDELLDTPEKRERFAEDLLQGIGLVLDSIEKRDCVRLEYEEAEKDEDYKRILSFLTLLGGAVESLQTVHSGQTPACISGVEYARGMFIANLSNGTGGRRIIVESGFDYKKEKWFFKRFLLFPGQSVSLSNEPQKAFALLFGDHTKLYEKNLEPIPPEGLPKEDQLYLAVEIPTFKR